MGVLGSRNPLFQEMGIRGLSGTSVWRPQSRYTVSRIECRSKFPQNQRCRAKIALHPPKSRCRTSLRSPLSHVPLIRSRQGARRAGRGYCGTFGFRKRIALQGGITATVTPDALLCATKSGALSRVGGIPTLHVPEPSERARATERPSLFQALRLGHVVHDEDKVRSAEPAAHQGHAAGQRRMAKVT